MMKHSTLHFIYRNYPDVHSEVIDVDKVFINQKAFSETLKYLDDFRATAPDKLVEKLLKEAHDV